MDARPAGLLRGADTSAVIIGIAKDWDAELIAIASRRAASFRGAILESMPEQSFETMNRPC